MDFELDSEHEMIRQTVHDFAEKEVRPVAAHVDKTGEFPRATVAKMGGLGFLGVAIPTEYEGAGLDVLALAIGIEEMARVCGSHALIMAAHNSLCTGNIWLAGSEAQKRKYIPDLASGRKIGAWALTEPTRGTRGISAFIVERGNPGLSIGKVEDKLGVRGSATSQVILSDCHLPMEALLGLEGEGFVNALKILDGGR